MAWSGFRTIAARFVRLVVGLGVLCLANSADAGDEALAQDRANRELARDHWAFRPINRPVVPEVKDSAWCRNPVDRFILAPLESKGWKPAMPVDRRTWARRVWFDLVGLPPDPEALEAFLADTHPDAAARLIDRLMADPAYGERFGRHWLDLARYAESNGYERDAAKPSAWKYRDYVIRSFNEDKALDRFVLEQLAGDELPDTTEETLIATSFLRLGPWDDEPADVAQDRFDQLDDLVATTGEVFLGLTIACARCHDHKFEPFSMTDYYRMVSVFDPLERPREGRTERDLPVGNAEVLAAFRARAGRIGELLGWLTRESRTEERAGILAELAGVERAQAAVPRGYILRESGPKPPATRLLRRGQASSPAETVSPGVPAAIVDDQPAFLAPGERTTRRRTSLARWMVSEKNPLTARVMANRVWQMHFGEGLVRSASDFGTAGDEPTHPELLDWLAAELIESGWSVKHLHRVILGSRVARMSKHNAPGTPQAEEDPEVFLWWRLPYRRLEVEATRDAMLQISGRLDRRMTGPSVLPAIQPEALAGHSDPRTVWPAQGEEITSRRTVYVFIKRSLVLPMLETFDLCDTTRSAARRTVTTIAPQALALLNGEFVQRQSRYLAARLVREAADSPEARIERLWALALSRPPTDEERAAARRYLTSVEEAGTGDERGGADGFTGLERLARAVLNLSEFQYTD
jgi:hypothetical protein